MKKYLILSFVLCCALYVNAQCLDFTNLRGDFVTCTYGDYYNPYSSIGIIDDGISSSSRHTVIRDKTATDPRTGNKLRLVPAGDAASVRLGNWNTGAQAESIAYDYFVDPEENPILVFKYAAVMEDPGHTPSDQPHFKMEILDQNGKAVDSYCGEFDFIADQSLGWNSYNYSGTILWKDWTSVGLDLTDYAGQTIKIRFTTYDCERSGHYGYAYINVACAQKRIKSLECGASATTTLTAPDGFEYRWYKYDAGNNIVEMGTAQAINVPTDETQYYCEVNQSGKPTCSFVLQAKADPRLPLADFTYDKHPACVDTLYFTNISAVSKDGQLPNFPLEECDEYVWDLGDGRIIEGRDITMPVVYEQTGDYTISLTAKLTHGGCEHTKSRTVHMLGYADTHAAVIYDTICDTESYVFNNQIIRTNGVYVERTKTNLGCDSMTTLYLTVLKSYINDIEATVCQGETYNFNGRVVSKDGMYYDTLTSVVTGCDSILRLRLNVKQKYYFEESASICDSEQKIWHNQYLTETGSYYDSLKSEFGCDSVYCLKLTVHPNYQTETTAAICDINDYYFRGKRLNKTGQYFDTIPTIFGCDSVFKLNLLAHPTFRDTTWAQVCMGENYAFRGHNYNRTGNFSDTICDPINAACNIYTLVLKILPSYYNEESVTICSSSQMTWRNMELTKTGVYYDTLQTVNGCDSVFCLKLTVNQAYLTETTEVICDMNDYNFRGTRLNKTGQYYDTIPTLMGCDSVFKLNLLAHPTFRDTTRVKICLGDSYSFRGRLYNIDGVYSDTICDPQKADCQIFTLMLTTVARSTILNAAVREACADDYSFRIDYSYVGATPLKYNLYFGESAQRFGFKNIVGAAFVDSIVVPIPQFANGSYIRPDIYNLRIELDNGTCNPSENAFSLPFMISYPSWIIEQNWNDVVAVLNDRYNGGYEFDDFSWYINNNLWMDSTPYIYSPQYLHIGDNVYAALQRKGENYKINTCPIVITDRTEYFVSDEPYLTLSSASSSRKIDIKSKSSGQYFVYDMTARQVNNGLIYSGEQTLTIDNTNGCYIMYFIADDGHSETHKLMIK